MTNLNALQAAIPSLSDRDQAFALSLLASAKRYGKLSDKQTPRVDRLIERAKNGDTKPAAIQVGNLARVLDLFDRAARHLKYPAIVLSVPAADITLRINVAGERARVPGSLNVTTAEKGDDNRRGWFGRIRRDGTFEPSNMLADDAALRSAISDRLQAFATDPAGIAADHGRLTGHCCFCNLALRDERSTAVGYGPVCADHFGLPWGEKRSAFSCEPAN